MRRFWIPALLLALLASALWLLAQRVGGGAQLERPEGARTQVARAAAELEPARLETAGSSARESIELRAAAESAPAAPGPAAGAHARGRVEVRGRVLDLARRPQPFAEVRFFRFLATDANGLTRKEPSEIGGRCDAQGEFRLPIPRMGGCIEAVGAELATVLAAVVEIPADPSRVHEVLVAETLEARGLLLDERDAPIAGALVQWRLPDALFAEQPSFDPSRALAVSVRSAADGSFRLERCPKVAQSALEALADGFLPGRWPAPAEDALARAVRLVRVAEDARLCGRVLDAAGAACAGASVSLGAEIALSDAQGQFCVDIAQARQRASARQRPLELVACKGPWLSQRLALPAERERWPDPLVLRLELERASLRGRVVDPSGAPLARLLVSLRDGTDFGLRELAPGSGLFSMLSSEALGGGADEVETDADGKFELRGLEPREYTLEVRDRSSFAFVAHGPVLAGAPPLSIVFDARVGWLAGRVLNLAGEPIADVRLSATYEAGSRSLEIGPSTRSASDGSFRLGPVGLDGALLRVEGESILPVLLWPVPPERSEDLRVLVSRRCGLRVDWSSVAAAATRVCVCDARGERVQLSRLEGGGIGLASAIPRGAEGEFLMPEDAVTALALNGEQELQRAAVRPLPGQLQTLRF